MEWGSNLQELVVFAVGIDLRPVDLLYFLLEWDFFVVQLVLWQMKSVYLLLECRSCVVGQVVWPVNYGYSLLESVLRFVSLVVQPIQVGCCLISPAPPCFSRTLLVLLQVRQSPSSFLMSDAQEQHLSGKTWYDDRWNMH